MLSKQGLVKTKQFKNSIYLGDPINAVRILNDKFIDELIILDIDAGKNKLGPDTKRIQIIVSECFTPVTYGGGLRNLDDIKNKLDISDKLLIETQTQLQTLQKFSDKTISDAHIQIQTLQKIIENIAKKAVDKPTNTVVNQIRNCFSDKYFVDDIKESDVKRKCQTYLTEQILMEGQRGIARLCTEHIINTNDNKKLLIATDQSRNKFRYMDEKGNIKDDIEARTFIEKVSKPIKEVAEIVFDNVLSTIKDEKETIEKDDYGRKAELNDKELQANHSMVYIKCFDDPKHNTDFTNELAILNKTK